jgi:hypothetical protein
MLLDTRKNAVLQVCDAGFLPFTLHLMNQIMHFCPNRTFDLVIASEDDLALRQWARDAGILFHRMGAGDLPPDLPLGHFVRAAFYRIKAPDQLANRYWRIPVWLRQFCGPRKLWNDAESFDIRFRESYAGFFRTRLPEALSLLSPGEPPRLLPFERMFADMMSHLRGHRKISAGFETFRAEWDVKP